MPETEPNRAEGPKPRRDAYDKAGITILTATWIAAVAAAVFTGWQAWIARDQEHRTLRAYVTLKAEIATHPGHHTPYIKLTAENAGQTPGYGLFFDFDAHVEGGMETYAFSNEYPLDCRSRPARDADAQVGRTIAKVSGAEVLIKSAAKAFGTADQLFENGGVVLAHGRVCYRDVFGEVHGLRRCFRWTSPDAEAGPCEGDGNTERDD